MVQVQHIHGKEPLRRKGGKYRLVKFLWLSASVYYMLPLFGVKAPAVLVEMFTFPQLATAVMGGICVVGAEFIKEIVIGVKE